MTPNEIYELCQHLPADPRLGDCFRAIAGDIPGLDLSDPKLHFIPHYKDLDFGWKAAKKLAQSHKPFPPVDTGYVWKAYLFHCDATKYWDQDVFNAMTLTAPQYGRRREVLHAVLLSKEATVKEAAKVMNMPLGTVAAYEKLFFNVIDRKVDSQSMAEFVYAETRLVESMPGYMLNESLGNLLLRFGYNNGAADVLYFAGLNNDLLHGLCSVDSPQRLEALIMGTGFLLARNNLIQPGGMYHAARGLLAAAKQSGTAPTTATPFESIADMMKGELMQATQNRAEEQTKRRLSSAKAVAGRVVA